MPSPNKTRNIYHLFGQDSLLEAIEKVHEEKAIGKNQKNIEKEKAGSNTLKSNPLKKNPKFPDLEFYEVNLDEQ